ncbi:hypothetical protein GALMADRAFT_241624 [Galerina marginata CBS 339.88]|uniref:CxC1-like cysteine cluster associated with KDZ transposases domain-containing protein n=1 Tax=Galerina marginata (strain CBS 339.88) TaxID=685588 RepID=A0A067TD04_GALM3|nr:hypothetical protein GALMADRAFT_241624 [Galerina marginata CBS 339.88]
MTDTSLGDLPDAAAVNAPDGNSEEDWQPVDDFLDNDTAFTEAMRETYHHTHTRRVYRDSRTWRQRLERQQANWQLLLESLTAAFLKWKYPDLPSGPTLPSDTDISMDIDDATDVDPVSYDFTIDCVDLYSLSSSIHVARSSSMTAHVAMVLQGFLPTSPVDPTLAVSIKTLELFRRLRNRKASLSVEAYAKVLCDLYAIPYHRRYRKALSDTFDVYLTILQRVDAQVVKILGRDSPNWRVKNACPACCYELKDEPYLRYRRMLAMDGNNSLKRIRQVGSRETADVRVFDSDYFLSHDFVNQYADEVKRKVSAKDKPVVPEDVPAPPDSDDEPAPGDPTDGAQLEPCADNWKASQAEELSRMWSIYEETGNFVAACRHGLILWVIDMVRSGELAKYPLAVVACAIKILGDRNLVGYDIGCSFTATLNSSSLGDVFKASLSRCCVNAFHGYSHNYLCQAQHHPNNIKGMGLEDLEGMERIFSGSNQLANVLRYATAYRRRLLIDLYVRQWDEDKYENLGIFIFNNYVQALKIIKEDSYALEHAMESLNIAGTAELDKWQAEELEYLRNLGKEEDYDVMAVAYVERLQELDDVNRRYDNTSATFMIETPAEYGSATASQPLNTYSSELSRTRRLETERRYADERRQAVLKEVVEMEVRLSITTRWHPATPEYINAVQYLGRRTYEKALDQLQKLVVQRLFELHKMNQSQNGYQMRSHIAKALQKRSKAIQRAVKLYNAAASALNPPRPTIDWNTVSHYKFLEEFPLLRNTSQELSGKRWSQPAVRETMKQWQRICRAREEVIRCNVEVRRLHTSILDEAQSFCEILVRSATLGPIHGAVKDFITRRTRVNVRLLQKIDQIYNLEDFSGEGKPGVRKANDDEIDIANRSTVPNAEISGNQVGDTRISELPIPPAPHLDAQENENDEGGESEDEDTREGVLNLLDFVSDLP